MEAIPASGNNLFKFGREQVLKHSQFQTPGNDSPVLFESFSSTLDLSTSILIETKSYHNSKKAIFTILLPGNEIIVVNSFACQLLSFTAEELCEMKLDNLVHECQKHKLVSLQKNFLKDSGISPFNSGKLVELVCGDGEMISVFLYLKRIDNPERCLAIAEYLDQKTAFVSVDESGKIISCDEEAASIFQYESSELLGVKINSLVPGVNMFKYKEHHWKPTAKQNITGKTKTGEIIPLCINISTVPSSEVFRLMIVMYPNLRGIILLNKNLVITSFNKYFLKLVFGLSKKEIINQPITNIIPTFYQDIGFEKNFKNRSPEKILNFKHSYRNWYKQNEFLKGNTSIKNSSSNDCISSLISSAASLSLNSDSEPLKKFERTEINDSENSFKILFSKKMERRKEESIIKNLGNDKYKFFSEEKSIIESNNTFDNHEVEECGINIDHNSILEGKFSGYGKHADGSFIRIKYQISPCTNGQDNYFCVSLSKDTQKFQNIGKELKAHTTVSSFNSTSLASFEDSLQNSVSSGQYTRPSTASLISQSDENLKAGEYSQFYTNIKAIGKGAFGYVKMAYRNSDGLLVITKFIKKQKINIRSWVFHPLLSMKIPLEISLLMSLQHPNIVKVLDVFHNDSFVQLVMEKHGAGFDLFEFISRRPKCDEKLKSYIFRQIVSAVAYLDSLGILHRDIKDENVIINENFKIKLIDFGSATFMPLSENFSNFYGTVQFCSPEVLEGNSYKGPELEIWTLGVTLYVLSFGEIPFANFEETIKGQFSIPSPISKELNDLLHKMLDKNVETRITIDKVVEDPWVNLPVCIDNYRFEEVVQCYDKEAHPPKYVYEIKSDDSKADSDPLLISIDSDSSLQNIPVDELGDFDDNYSDTYKSNQLESTGEEQIISPVFFSTPLEKSKILLQKSSYEFTKNVENSSTLSNYSCDSLRSNSEESEFNLSDSFPSNLKCDSSSLKNYDNLRRAVIPIFDDNKELRFEVHSETGSREEDGHHSGKESSESENNLTVSQDSYDLNDYNEPES